MIIILKKINILIKICEEEILIKKEKKAIINLKCYVHTNIFYFYHRSISNSRKN